ncbi:YtpI family protein [Oceanobacillus alkalisoli]|uniref:YtpI family protein n=1 Tax=Oceanobacillus alkalisoli TaxID=2925113 RepID=UPI001EF15CF8|nr:YtpI family protein [Oceanobacillus alkalisoli]MCF3943346.1 YtpI family protein [Oceanobacillus alkalisoli]MCG5105287.1 YtpI family protein [Oceanobacillus alkalisoli]
MIIFTIGIVISIVLYVYYKVAIVKSKDILTQKYFNGRSRLCLGAFILLFAINQYFFYESVISIFIGIIFALLGGMQIIRGYNESRHYKKEYRRLHPAE